MSVIRVVMGMVLLQEEEEPSSTLGYIVSGGEMG